MFIGDACVLINLPAKIHKMIQRFSFFASFYKLFCYLSQIILVQLIYC